MTLIDRRDFLRGAAGAVFGGALFPRVFTYDLSALTHAGTFDMIVLGDSIMWGQGLKDEQKFSYRVEQWVRDQLPGVHVRRHVLAHSGARIKADAAEDAKPPKHGEVPWRYPSITAQLERAKTIVDPASVSLILLDGGINDFGSKVIVNPDPTVDADWVRRVTREKTVDRMKGLLPKVADAFPNAKVVLTNYFLIVSRKSELVILWELLRAWELIEPPKTEWVRDKMAAHALAFHEESTAGFREAVREVTQKLLATNNTKTTLPRRNVAMNVERLALPPSRVALADVGFGPEHAYGAPQTRLFYVNEPDPAASVRKPMCVAQLPDGSPEFANCLIAASGHPNVAGARAYADAIIGVAQRWLPEWQATYGVTPARTTVRRPAIGRP
ncbi:MAG: SGNH/GDSL hydrolase family protein [Gemmatimonadota bacterium]|nr:SGNH/GDSL hydrolase family protein [Gemmatimonadota bacterium]